MTAAGPTLSGRHESLDILRGIAILGILVVNLPAFAFPFAAYSNPAAMGPLQGADSWAWLITFLFFEQKFITLFALMFGAGAALFREHALAAGDRAGVRHYRRMAAMLLIGLVHAYAIWFGDILVTYAIAGMLIYPLVAAQWRVRTLLLVGLALIGVTGLMMLGLSASAPHMPAEQLAEMAAHWAPDAEHLNAEISAYRGGWLEQMTMRAPAAFQLQVPLFMFYGARIIGLMLIGVAAYRSGWLLARWSVKAYLLSGLPLLVAGLWLSWWGAQQHLAAGFAFEYSMLHGMQPQYYASLLQAYGYGALVMALVAAGRAGLLQKLFAPVGRMAFTNYLMQSLICTTLFYGHGFGQFASWSRAELWALAICIWLFQLIVSMLWLQHFRYGPAEWLWRTMTYGKLS